MIVNYRYSQEKSVLKCCVLLIWLVWAAITHSGSINGEDENILLLGVVDSNRASFHQQHYVELLSYPSACRELFSDLPETEMQKIIQWHSHSYDIDGCGNVEHIIAAMKAGASDEGFCFQYQCYLLNSDNITTQEAGIRLLSWIIRRSQITPEQLLTLFDGGITPASDSGESISAIEKAFLLSKILPRWRTKLSTRAKWKVCKKRSGQVHTLSLDELRQQLMAKNYSCSYKQWLSYLLDSKPKYKELKKLLAASEGYFNSFFNEPDNVSWWMIELLSHNYAGIAAQLIKDGWIDKDRAINVLLNEEVPKIAIVSSVKLFSDYWCDWILNTFKTKNEEKIQPLLKLIEHEPFLRALLKSKAYINNVENLLHYVIQWKDSQVVNGFRFTFENHRQILAGVHKGVDAEGVKVPGRFSRKVVSTYQYLDKVFPETTENEQALSFKVTLSQLEQCKLTTHELAKVAWKRKNHGLLNRLVSHAPSHGRLVMESSASDRKKIKSFSDITDSEKRAESAYLTEYLIRQFPEQCKPEAALYYAADAGFSDHCSRLVTLGADVNYELEGKAMVYRALDNEHYHTAMTLVGHGAKWLPLNAENTVSWGTLQPASRYCRQIILAPKNPWVFYHHLFMKHPEISDYVVWNMFCSNKMQPVRVRPDHGQGPLRIYLNAAICKNNSASDVAAALVGKLTLLGYEIRNNRDVRVVVLMNNSVEKKKNRKGADIYRGYAWDLYKALKKRNPNISVKGFGGLFSTYSSGRIVAHRLNKEGDLEWFGNDAMKGCTAGDGERTFKLTKAIPCNAGLKIIFTSKSSDNVHLPPLWTCPLCKAEYDSRVKQKDHLQHSHISISDPRLLVGTSQAAICYESGSHGYAGGEHRLFEQLLNKDVADWVKRVISSSPEATRELASYLLNDSGGTSCAHLTEAMFLLKSPSEMRYRLLTLLKSYQPDCEQKGDFRGWLLKRVCESKDTERVKYLLGCSPEFLTEAIIAEEKSVVEYCGRNLDKSSRFFDYLLKNKIGLADTALDWLDIDPIDILSDAAALGCEKVIEWLEKKGYSLLTEVCDGSGKYRLIRTAFKETTPLHLAKNNEQYSSLFKFLMQGGRYDWCNAEHEQVFKREATEPVKHQHHFVITSTPGKQVFQVLIKYPETYEAVYQNEDGLLIAPRGNKCLIKSNEKIRVCIHDFYGGIDELAENILSYLQSLGFCPEKNLLVVRFHFSNDVKNPQKLAEFLHVKGCRGKVVCSNVTQWSVFDSKSSIIRGEVKEGRLYWQGERGEHSHFTLSKQKDRYQLLNANKVKGGYKQVYKMGRELTSCIPPEWSCPLCDEQLDWQNPPAAHYQQVHAQENDLMSWFKKLPADEQLNVLKEKYSDTLLATLIREDAAYYDYCQLIMSTKDIGLCRALLKPLNDPMKLANGLLKLIGKEAKKADIRPLYAKIKLLLQAEIADMPLSCVLEKIHQCENKALLTPPDLLLPFIAAKHKKWKCLQIMHQSGVCFYLSVRHALDASLYHVVTQLIKMHPQPEALLLAAAKEGHSDIVQKVCEYRLPEHDEILHYAIDQDDYQGICALDQMHIDLHHFLNDMKPVDYARSKHRYYAMFALLQLGHVMTEEDDSKGEHLLFSVKPTSEYSHQLIICAADEASMLRRYKDLLFYTADINTTDVIELSRQGRGTSLVNKNRALFRHNKPLKLVITGHGPHILGMKGDELGCVISNIMKLYLPDVPKPAGIDIYLLSCNTRVVQKLGTVNQYTNADLFQKTLNGSLEIPVSVTAYAGSYNCGRDDKRGPLVKYYFRDKTLWYGGASWAGQEIIPKNPQWLTIDQMTPTLAVRISSQKGRQISQYPDFWECSKNTVACQHSYSPEYPLRLHQQRAHRKVEKKDAYTQVHWKDLMNVALPEAGKDGSSLDYSLQDSPLINSPLQDNSLLNSSSQTE